MRKANKKQMKALPKISLVNEAKKKFKKGDKVVAKVKFGDSIGTKDMVGTVEEIYASFITVVFSGKFRQSYSWSDIRDNEVVAY